MPVVLAASPPHRIAVDSVLLDDFGGSWEATSTLVSRGHRKIGFWGFPLRPGSDRTIPPLWRGSGWSRNPRRRTLCTPAAAGREIGRSCGRLLADQLSTRASRAADSQWSTGASAVAPAGTSSRFVATTGAEAVILVNRRHRVLACHDSDVGCHPRFRRGLLGEIAKWQWRVLPPGLRAPKLILPSVEWATMEIALTALRSTQRVCPKHDRSPSAAQQQAARTARSKA
jgi:hypothetical protein